MGIDYKDLIRQVVENLFGREKEQTASNTAFFLLYNDSVIASLEYSDGQWVFQYDEEFKENPFIPAIVSFPDLEKVYKSVDLWPFFALRIPSVSRPEIYEQVVDDGIDHQDAAQMLQRFGQESISNPFELRSQVDAPRRVVSA